MMMDGNHNDLGGVLEMMKVALIRNSVNFKVSQNLPGLVKMIITPQHKNGNTILNKEVLHKFRCSDLGMHLRMFV